MEIGADGFSAAVDASAEAASDVEDGGKVFNDPVHGHIELDDVCVQVIDTPQFQRLRNLKQTGAACFVFPGATHTRFEHSIGVCHLAGELVNHLRKKQPELGITDNDAKCVRLAGLCHDLGHGPFSHLFDGGVIARTRPGVDWKHEMGSEDMLEYLVSDNPVDISPEELRFIKDLIHGEPRGDYPQSGKRYLFEIVSNQRNSVDVDKFDYIQRDCVHIGLKSSLDAGRIIKFARVVDGQLCFHQKEAMNMCELFHTRYSLFKRVYTHKVSTAIEYMIMDALVAADDYFGISSSIDDMSRYLHMNDSILCEIERSTCPELEESRRIMSRLRRRDLYRLADQVIVPFELREHLSKSQITAERVAEYAPISRSQGVTIQPDDVIVQWLKLSYSPKDRHPLEMIRFYRKYETNQSIAIRRDQVSAFIPEHCEELIIRVYSRDHDKTRYIQHAFRRLLEVVNAELGGESGLQGTESQMLLDSPIRSDDSQDGLEGSGRRDSMEGSQRSLSSKFLSATPIPDRPNNVFLLSSPGFPPYSAATAAAADRSPDAADPVGETDQPAKSASAVPGSATKRKLQADAALELPEDYATKGSPYKRSQRSARKSSVR
ncbi:hypothetical protein HK105_207226 [Polyrhizophydium stewartii]|uniref:HD/PDEase domain-containing protein n=1 Tax=Polyrhizophydium stewartii TaxID=2732419 RepID=A0ABR4N128_9FUNG